MHNNIPTRIDIVAQAPFKKQPPSLAPINYDQVIYAVHIQYEWQGNCIRFMGYVSPGTNLEVCNRLDPLINVVLRRLLINDVAGQPVDGVKEGAPLMKAWEGDKLVTIEQMCQEVGVHEENVSLFARPGKFSRSDCTDYEDTPQHKELAELHEKLVPIMLRHGLGAAKIRCEDGQVALLDMIPLGLAYGNPGGFCKEVIKVVGQRPLVARIAANGGSTFRMEPLVQEYASFAL